MLGSALAAALAVALTAAAPATTVYVVDLTTGAPPPATVLAVQACSGLANRAGNASYVLLNDRDAGWLARLAPPGATTVPLSPEAFVTGTCLLSLKARAVRYNYTAQQALVPLLLTAAGVLDAVPLEDGSPLVAPGTPPPAVAFDAVAAWPAPGTTPLAATAFAYDAWGNATSTASKMNPGYDTTVQPYPPPLSGQPDLSLGDYIVSARLFNFYLLDGCLPGTPENAWMEGVAARPPPGWPAPIAVWGYDDTWPVAGGDTFEAETLCVGTHNMGQVASSGVTNLAFLSRSGGPPVTAPLVQAPVPAVGFNASRSYVALLVGDGDNIAYLQGSRYDWVTQRAAACAASPRGAGCAYPLGWTLSPHLAASAPDLLRWYHAATVATGADWLVLPPSGHLYAYPSLMRPGDQAGFVAATQGDARLLNTSMTVAWEFAGTWGAALANYTPRYTAAAAPGAFPGPGVLSLVAVNVPYFVPILEFAPGEYFKVINGTGSGDAHHPVVVFAPNEWRGTAGGGLCCMQNASAFAGAINAYPPGTVTVVYMTSDGGAELSDYDALVAGLAEHVVVVPPDAAAGLALASAAAKAGAARGASAAAATHAATPG
jgi:hypothetical protein